MSMISISELNKLTCFQQCLEKSLSVTVEHLKKYSNYEDFTEMYSIQEKERQIEISLLKSNNKEIMDNIKSKISFLKQKNVLNSTDLKQFKDEMIMIQNSIQDLMKSSKMKIKTLNIDYININQDVDYYREKMLEWSQPVNIKDTLNIKTDYKRPDSGLKCLELRKFIDFVRQSGGHENGWDKDDHRLFLRLRNKLKDVTILAQKVNELLPDKSIEDVKEHNDWYKKYLILKRNKKEALKRWQQSKNKTKLPSNMTNMILQKDLVVQSQEDLKEKLINWKLEKEIKMRASLSVEKLEEQKKKELEDLKKKRHEEVKKIVEEWKTTKIIIEKENDERRKNHEEKEKKRKSTEANKLIKQFQSQDDYYILKMKQLKKRHETLKPIRSKSSQIAKRDPERVLKPTRQWINRVHDDKFYPVNTIIPLKKLPKLRIPDWRKQEIE